MTGVKGGASLILVVKQYFVFMLGLRFARVTVASGKEL